jgi:CBS-domain-containing membrane protein
LLRQLKSNTPLTPESLINQQPLTVQATDSVVELLKLLKRASFPVMYLPVVDRNQQAMGIVNFVNLIKGEL